MEEYQRADCSIILPCALDVHLRTTSPNHSCVRCGNSEESAVLPIWEWPLQQKMMKLVNLMISLAELWTWPPRLELEKRGLGAVIRSERDELMGAYVVPLQGSFRVLVTELIALKVAILFALDSGTFPIWRWIALPLQSWWAVLISARLVKGDGWTSWQWCTQLVPTKWCFSRVNAMGLRI